jgi:ABC-type transport system involved in multi-copper enzyme maturation permease subunit
MLEQYALKLEPDVYYDQLIMQYRQKIESENEGIANYQAEMEELEPDQLAQMRPYYEVQINDCRREIADHEYVISMLEKLKEQDAHPESNSFGLVNTILPMMLRERRNAQSNIEMDAANDEFFLLAIANKSSANHRIRTLNKAQIAIEYAVEHNILPEGLHQSSAKNTLINNLSTASFLISAITVVLASMILSREFATGTVRLWVIRPKTRNKLLGSKIATLLIYVCTMMGASFVITYFFALINHVVDLFFYGQSTLFVNNYGVLFGKAVAIPAVAEHVWALIVLTLPVILYAMLCLFISVLTKKGVLSIVCGMIVLMFASDIQTLVLIVANYTGIFGYALQATVLPYLGMNRLLVTSMDFGIMSSAMELDNLGALLGIEDMLMSQIWGAMPYVCSSFVGAGVLVAHIVLIIWASLFAFKRTQIKS